MAVPVRPKICLRLVPVDEFMSSHKEGKPSPAAKELDKSSSRVLSVSKGVKKSPEGAKEYLRQKKDKLRGYFHYHWFKLVHTKGSAMSLALPVAFALATAFIPTFGLGAPLTLLFAWAFKLNKTAGVIAYLAITPFVPLFYTADVVLARLLTKGRLVVEDLGEQASQALEAVSQQSIFQPASILKLGSNIVAASLIIAALIFVILFPVFYFAISSYQKKHQARQKAKWGHCSCKNPDKSSKRCQLTRNSPAAAEKSMWRFLYLPRHLRRKKPAASNALPKP